jgi:3-isopropylmalate dehydratase small subunit
LIGSSFADIFARNCEENGLLTIILADDNLTTLKNAIAGDDRSLTVDLAECTISHSILPPIKFHVSPHVRSRLLAGLDTLGEALFNDDAVTKFERNYKTLEIRL